MSAIARIVDEARRHPIATARWAFKRVLEIPARGLPKLSGHQDQEDDFDARYGVETAKIQQVVITDSRNAAQGTRYETTSEAMLRWCIENAGLAYETTTFIDIGCGKGRPLIVAAQYPFKRVVGIEYSKQLVELCSLNLWRAKVNDRAEVICEDAASYVLPEGDLLVLMNNPLKEPLLSQVLERVAAHPGKVVLAYRGPGLDVVKASDLFDEVERGPEAARLFRPLDRARRAA